MEMRNDPRHRSIDRFCVVQNAQPYFTICSHSVAISGTRPHYLNLLPVAGRRTSREFVFDWYVSTNVVDYTIFTVVRLVIPIYIYIYISSYSQNFRLYHYFSFLGLIEKFS